MVRLSNGTDAWEWSEVRYLQNERTKFSSREWILDATPFRCDFARLAQERE